MSAPPTQLFPRSKQRPGWLAALQGGVTGSLAVLAVPLSLGLLAYAALGAAAPAFGLRAAFVTAAVGGALYALCSRARVPAAGSSSATALILAGLVAELAAAGRTAPDTAAPLLLAGCALAVALSGVLQIGLARIFHDLRVGSLVPRRVVIGI